MVPCFNEGENLPRLIEQIRGENLAQHCDLLFVDDGSVDGSADLIKKSGFPVYSHPTNAGYGAAIKSGLRYAHERSYTHLGVFPGDGQRQVSDMLALFREAEKGSFDLVVGSKLHLIRAIPWRRAVGNRLFSSFARVLGRAPFADVLSGFKVYRVASVLPLLDWLPERYDFDLVFAIHCGRSGLSVREIPVQVRYHAHSTKMKSVAAEGLRMLSSSLKTLYGRGVRPIEDPLGQ
ncbi:MAG: glycosyltransferase family 2 protein [Deltaproteobacteria bacterium]|nr:glycosyltransferase family 2 protein [Deltaproteobacteria bacterium]